MKMTDIIEQNVQACAGELLLLTEGEYDAYRVVALVRVCRDTNLRLQADAFLERERIGMTSPARTFCTRQFADFLVSEGAVERLPFCEVQVAGDMECLIATPEKGRGLGQKPESVPYEWAEALYDPAVRR